MKNSWSEKQLFRKKSIKKKQTSPIDNLKVSEREPFRITTILEPIVRIYEECLWVHSYSVELHRSSHRRCLLKKAFWKISQNSQENTCSSVSFLIKLRAWGLQLYWKRDSGTGVFPVNFAKFLRTRILKNICEWLLLITGWRTT